MKIIHRDPCPVELWNWLCDELHLSERERKGFSALALREDTELFKEFQRRLQEPQSQVSFCE